MSAVAGEASDASALTPDRRGDRPPRIADLAAGATVLGVIALGAVEPRPGAPDLALALAVTAGLALAASGVAAATGRVRLIRSAILGSLLLWLAALVVAVVSPDRNAPEPRLSYLLLAVAVAPLLAWTGWLLEDQPTATGRAAIQLDVLVLALSVMAIVIAIAGPGLVDLHEPADALLMLASPTIFAAVGVTSGVAAASAGRQLRPLDPNFVLAAGVGLLGIAGLALTSGVHPLGSPRPAWIAVGIGVVLIGAASRRVRPSRAPLDPAGVMPSALRRNVPLFAIVPAALSLLPVFENPSEVLEVVQTSAVALAVAVLVVRQHFLDRERELLLETATASAARAQQARDDANRAADESTAALARLAEAEERFRALVERLPAVVYVDAIDPSAPNERAENVYLGPQVEGLTGYPSQAFVDDNDLWDALVVEDDRAELESHYEQHGRDGSPLRVTYRIRHRDGRIVWVEEHASVIGMTETGFRLSQGVLVDVTEQRTLEEQLLAAQRMEAVGRLAGGVAHDFNNLLTAILGYASIVAAELPPGDPLREDVTAITQAAGSASSLVRQLLAFSRRQMLRPEELDLTSVVDRVVPLLRRLAGEPITFRAHLASDLPGVRADPGQLEQVLVNLIVNARDAMPDGGTVTVETAEVLVDDAEARRHLGLRPGRYVGLTVTDTGVGMDREVRERVFEPFFTTKEPGRGTGLGLATVYGIVKQSDGYIGVTSEPGQGALFRVLLPALPAPVAEVAPAPAAPQTADPGTERLLLVEDEDTVRLLAATVLRRLGYSVELAGTGAEALAILEREGGRFDLVVSDIVMPELGGTELAAAVRERWPAVAIVLMSGYAPEVVGREGPVVEDAFLAKPFAPQELGSLVRNVLDQRSGRPSNASSAAIVAGGISSGRSDR